MKNLRVAVALLLLQSTNAFQPSTPNAFTRPSTQTMMAASANNQNLVVISPPGGVGEVAAVQAAKMGSSVRWFVISPPASTSSVTLSAQTMESIQNSNGGTVELAGAKADTLLLSPDDSASSVNAVKTWCGAADGVICVMDGVDDAVAALNEQFGGKGMNYDEVQKAKNAMVDAIKVAAKEASGSATGMKIAVLPAKEGDDADEEEKEGGDGLLSGLFKGNAVDVPSSLTAAMGSNSLATLRYGELFGIPESSVS